MDIEKKLRNNESEKEWLENLTDDQKKMPYFEYVQNLPEPERTERLQKVIDMTEFSKKFGIIRTAELSLDYGIAKGLTVGEAMNNEDFIKKSALIDMEKGFDWFENEILSSHNEPINQTILDDHFKLRVPNPASKYYEIEMYFNQRLEKLFTMINLKAKENVQKEIINPKSFTKLELDLNLLDENLYIDHITRAKKIQDLINTKDHKVFNYIEIKGEVKTDTIYSYIRHHYSQSTEIEYFNEKSKEKYKELYTKVKGYLGR
jgi:hypothetical protein